MSFLINNTVLRIPVILVYIFGVLAGSEFGDATSEISAVIVSSAVRIIFKNNLNSTPLHCCFQFTDQFDAEEKTTHNAAIEITKK